MFISTSACGLNVRMEMSLLRVCNILCWRCVYSDGVGGRVGESVDMEAVSVGLKAYSRM